MESSLGQESGVISSSPGNWYAIRVKSKCERCVAMGLEGKGYNHFLPLSQEYRNWSNRIRKVERILIPGYVFAQFDLERRLPVLTTTGVAHIVGTRQGPLPIARDELAAIRLITQSGSFAEPWPSAEVGQRVIVVAGPLCGLRGYLAEVKSQCRVVVSVTLLQRSVAAEVDRNHVHADLDIPASDSWPATFSCGASA